VLEYLAKDFGLPLLADTDDLERSVRIKIAADATEYLAPSWNLACALIAMGPQDAHQIKLDMLEMAASLAVPSRSARQQLHTDWQALCARWSDGRDVFEELRPILDNLKQQRKEKIEHALTLGLVITFADGRFSVEEEKLYKLVCDKLSVDPEEANSLLRRVNNLFWDHTSQVGPKRIENVSPEAEKATALEAARRTLESSGSLEGLMLETSDQVGSSGGGGGEAPPQAQPKKGWQKMFGALTGLSQYLSSRQRTPEQVLLARIAYLAILRQHRHAVASMPKPAAPAAPAPPPAAAPAAAPEAAAPALDQVEGPSPKRSIKLP
jgi:tellurite resistance protein